MKEPSDILENELDDFLDMVKKQLKNYTMMLVERKYHQLYAEVIQLRTEKQRLEALLKENQIIWEK